MNLMCLSRSASCWRVHSISAEDVLAAIELHRRQGVSFWEAMILRSAAALGCRTLFSGDLGDGQRYDGVQVQNPFAGAGHHGRSGRARRLGDRFRWERHQPYGVGLGCDSPTMTAHIRNIVFECADARALATFYADLLGWRIIREDWLVVAETEDSLLRLAFDEVPGYRPPRWPDRTYPQQLHLDIGVDDGEAAAARALRLGATRLPDLGGSCPVFADPAGHPFCLCAPGQ